MLIRVDGAVYWISADSSGVVSSAPLPDFLHKIEHEGRTFSLEDGSDYLDALIAKFDPNPLHSKEDGQFMCKPGARRSRYTASGASSGRGSAVISQNPRNQHKDFRAIARRFKRTPYSVLENEKEHADTRVKRVISGHERTGADIQVPVQQHIGRHFEGIHAPGLSVSRVSTEKEQHELRRSGLTPVGVEENGHHSTHGSHVNEKHTDAVDALVRRGWTRVASGTNGENSADVLERGDERAKVTSIGGARTKVAVGRKYDPSTDASEPSRLGQSVAAVRESQRLAEAGGSRSEHLRAAKMHNDAAARLRELLSQHEEHARRHGEYAGG